MPTIVSIDPTVSPIVIAVQKDNVAQVAKGKIFAYPTEEQAEAHANLDDHHVGDWSSPASENVKGVGTASATAAGKFIVVSEEGPPLTWSEPERVP